MDGLWGVLRKCGLIQKYDLHCIIDTIVEYMPIKEVRFGDVIRIQRHGSSNQQLSVNGIARFQIVKCDGSINRKEVLHFGQNFLLKGYKDGKDDQCKYVQRDGIRLNDMNSVHKTMRFNMGLMEFDKNMEYKQTAQFDNADEQIMGKIVKFDGNKIGLTFGGNYVIQKQTDHENACNNFRTWMTLRGSTGECVVSWFASDEHLTIIQD